MWTVVHEHCSQLSDARWWSVEVFPLLPPLPTAHLRQAGTVRVLDQATLQDLAHHEVPLSSGAADGLLLHLAWGRVRVLSVMQVPSKRRRTSTDAELAQARMRSV